MVRAQILLAAPVADFVKAPSLIPSVLSFIWILIQITIILIQIVETLLLQENQTTAKSRVKT